jgi:hypothetical protein
MKLTRLKSRMFDNDINSLYPSTINFTVSWDTNWWKSRAQKRNNRTHKNRMDQKDWEHKAPSRSVGITSTIASIENYPKDRTVVFYTTSMIRKRYDMEQWCNERNIRYRIEDAMVNGFTTEVMLFKRSNDMLAFTMYWADEE